jgi:hypothetical protein
MASNKSGNGNPGQPTPLHASQQEKGKGQKRSSERGSATNSKKNPGKRPSQGGSSR